VTAIGHTTRGDDDRLSLDRVLEVAVAVGVVLLVVIGFITSYETLRALAVTAGGFTPWLAPAVPLSFDLGIVVLSLKIVAAARQGRRAFLHRGLVTALSIATVAVNSTASPGAAGRMLHAIPPAMFVVCFEGLITDARRTAMAGRSRRNHRWKASLLAPVSTLSRWREDAVRSAAAQPKDAGCAPSARPRNARHQAPAGPAPGPRQPANPDLRMEVAREALRRKPDLTAPALARTLGEHGHVVSVRTAQRLKARAASLG
jgi:hypothetical protein